MRVSGRGATPPRLAITDAASTPPFLWLLSFNHQVFLGRFDLMLADDRGHPFSIKIMKTLDNVLLAAQQAEVGFSCVYCVGDNSWYFTVDSAAPSENWMGKNHSFGIAVECVLEHLAKLNHDNTLA